MGLMQSSVVIGGREVDRPRIIKVIGDGRRINLGPTRRRRIGV